jgi:hypothetical protein
MPRLFQHGLRLLIFRSIAARARSSTSRCGSRYVCGTRIGNGDSHGSKPSCCKHRCAKKHNFVPNRFCRARKTGYDPPKRKSHAVVLRSARSAPREQLLRSLGEKAVCESSSVSQSDHGQILPTRKSGKAESQAKERSIRKIRAKLRVSQFPFGAVKGHSAVPRTDPHL